MGDERDRDSKWTRNQCSLSRSYSSPPSSTQDRACNATCATATKTRSAPTPSSTTTSPERSSPSLATTLSSSAPMMQAVLLQEDLPERERRREGDPELWLDRRRE